MQQYAVRFILLQNHSTCFGCHRTHHQEYCNRSLRYFLPDLATMEESSWTDIMTFTGGCGYSF